MIFSSARIDRSIVRGSETRDKGYRAYMAALLLDHYYNNSVLLVFCFLLLDCDPARHVISRPSTDVFNDEIAEDVEDAEDAEDAEEVEEIELQPSVLANSSDLAPISRDEGSQISADSSNPLPYLVSQSPYPQPAFFARKGSDLTQNLLSPTQPPMDLRSTRTSEFYTSPKSSKRMGGESGKGEKLPPNRLRARTRWHLALLLLYHPELILQRKHYLTIFKPKNRKSEMSMALKVAASKMRDKIMGDMKRLTGWVYNIKTQRGQEREGEVLPGGAPLKETDSLRHRTINIQDA